MLLGQVRARAHALLARDFQDTLCEVEMVLARYSHDGRHGSPLPARAAMTSEIRRAALVNFPRENPG